MKKFAEKIATLTLAGLTLGNAEAKEVKDYTHGKLDDFNTEIKAKASKAIDHQTYDATPDFQKSREKYDEWVDPTEIDKREKEAQRVIKLLGGLEGEDLDAKARAENFSIEYLTDLIKKLEEVRQQYDKFDSRGGSEATEEDDVANSNGEEKFSGIKRKVYIIKRKLEKYRAKKEITDAKEKNGVVTDYTQIAKNPKLAEAVGRLYITFKKDEDGVVGVYVNGVYTNFDIVDSESFVSCKIFTVSNGVAFEVKSNNAGNGIVYQMKYILKGNKVLEFYKEENDTEWKQSKKTFKIPANENPAKKEISMSH